MSDGQRKAKVERATKDPRRPGEGCKAEPGTYEIVVDRARCEGKRDCIDARRTSTRAAPAGCAADGSRSKAEVAIFLRSHS